MKQEWEWVDDNSYATIKVYGSAEREIYAVVTSEKSTPRRRRGPWRAETEYKECRTGKCAVMKKQRRIGGLRAAKKRSATDGGNMEKKGRMCEMKKIEWKSSETRGIHTAFLRDVYMCITEHSAENYFHITAKSSIGIVQLRATSRSMSIDGAKQKARALAYQVQSVVDGKAREELSHGI